VRVDAEVREKAIDAALAFAETSPETTSTRTVTWQDPIPTAAKGAQMAGLDYVRAIQAGELPPPPIAVVMNFSIVELEEGRAVFEGEPGEEHYNPIGVVHGGYGSTILDSALGCAVHTTLPAGVGYTSIEIKVSYLRALSLQSGTLVAHGWVTKPGRRVAFADADVRDSAGTVVATASGSCLIMGG
jgi:uncharacterized protein (TIGR00369 family)